MEWVGQFLGSTDDLFNGGLEGYFTLNAGAGGSTPTQVTGNSPTKVTFTSQIFLAQVSFFGSNLSVGSTTLPSGMSLPVLTGGAITRIEFLYNYRLSDAINAGIDAPELSQAAFLQPSATITLPSISALAMTNAIVQSYASGSTQPFLNYLSQFNANFSGSDGPNIINGFNGGDLLRGFGGNDSLRGNDGDDVLDGGTGSDTLNGGNGSDLYLPGPPATGGLGDAVGDSGTKAGDIDTISYENATGAVVVDLNLLDGNQSAGWAANLMSTGIERVIGSRFNDTIIGTDFPESVSDTSADILEGGDGDDVLFGLGGSDTLQGGRGFDTLVGGQNGDVATTGPGDRAKFAVHSSQVDVFFPGDGSVLVATPGGGVDQLFEMEFIETTNGVFNIGSFAASARQLLVGDDKDNPINGDGRESLIYGRDGNDTLNGGGASDHIEGGSGNDTIDGESGADIMRGELGNDTFIVDNVADAIFELAGEGTDTVRTSVTFDLLSGVSVENFSATNQAGTGKINLYGNEFAQKITGNAGANIISDGGKGGTDTLVGLGGGDTYKVYNSATKIVEGKSGGSDTVLA
ncbi:MAG: hypothetical protein KF914_13835, partial [Rhizobiaceae bacterium]|nr:hypothetical protein [Rhizobiaceae bacterium]